MLNNNSVNPLLKTAGRSRAAVMLLALPWVMLGCASAAPAGKVNREAYVEVIIEEEEHSGEESKTKTVSANQDTAAVPVEKPEPVKVRGIYVSGPAAGTDKIDELIRLVVDTELNALVIDIKNDEGLVTYKMQSDTVLEIGAGTNYIRDIKELVRKCKENNIYLIGRIVAFKDPYLAEHKPGLSLTDKEGEIFRDKSGLAWVNPYKKQVWGYLLEIAAEAAKEGFDEIQFDYIRFSTDLKADSLDFGPEAEGRDKKTVIAEFTEYVYERLSPLGVYVSADVYGTVIDNASDQKIVGQDYRGMAEHLDYICPMVYPSHYGAGAYGIAVPDASPYEIISAALNASAGMLGGADARAGMEPDIGSGADTRQYARVRPWLQSFTAQWVAGHISYGPKAIREEIDAVYDAGYEEWILWNAAVNYQEDSLLPAGGEGSTGDPPQEG